MTPIALPLMAAIALSAAARLPASAQSNASFELFTNLATQTSTISDGLGNTVTGDFNNDGKPDLITSASAGYVGSSSSLVFSAGNGDGTFQARVTLSAASSQTPLIATDLNNDGTLDLVTDSQAASGSLISSELAAYYGKGNGTFDGPFGIPGSTVPGYANIVAVGDVNGDGLPDIAVGGNNSTGTQGNVAVNAAESILSVRSATHLSSSRSAICSSSAGGATWMRSPVEHAPRPRGGRQRRKLPHRPETETIADASTCGPAEKLP